MAINDIDREFLLSFGLDREFATGAVRVGASPPGPPHRAFISAKGSAISILAICVHSRSPALPVSDLRPKPRPDVAKGGDGRQYSIPYTQSKVQSLDFPDFIRGLTPMTEFVVDVPTGPKTSGSARRRCSPRASAMPAKARKSASRR